MRAEPSTPLIACAHRIAAATDCILTLVLSRRAVLSPLAANRSRTRRRKPRAPPGPRQCLAVEFLDTRGAKVQRKLVCLSHRTEFCVLCFLLYFVVVNTARCTTVFLKRVYINISADGRFLRIFINKNAPSRSISLAPNQTPPHAPKSRIIISRVIVSCILHLAIARVIASRNHVVIAAQCMSIRASAVCLHRASRSRRVCGRGDIPSRSPWHTLIISPF